MLFGEVIRVALQALRNHRLRSALTMLGIIIGVAAMITMVALGQGAQKSVQGRIESLGPDLLTVFAGQSFRGGVAAAERVSLTVDDAAALARDTRYLRAIVPELRRDLQVKSGSRRVGTAHIMGRHEHIIVSRPAGELLGVQNAAKVGDVGLDNIGGL